MQGVEDGELNWLIENKIISIERDVSSDLMFSNDADLNIFKEYRGVGYGSYLLLGGEKRESYVKSSSNFISRFNSIIMGNDETRAVPLLYDEKFRHDILGAKIKYPFLEVAPDRYGLATASIICMLPVPGDLTPWERILDFRQEKENWSYFLNLRNFIRDSVNGGLRISDIKDEIEHKLYIAERNLKNKKIEFQYKCVETILVSSVEVIEDILKFKWSNVIKKAFSIRRAREDLLNFERKVSEGSEYYIIKANEALGSKL